MGRKLYAVVRHDGHWGIIASNGSFLSCESYEEALDVATTAAAILRSARAAPGFVGTPIPSGGNAAGRVGRGREP